MFKNYFKTAWRSLRKHRVFSVINISGLAIGLAAFWMITLYVSEELSYDDYNVNANRIFRVVPHLNWHGGNLDLAPTSAPFAPALKSDYPEVEEAVRIDPQGGGTITYGNKKLQADDILFVENSIFKIFSYHFLYGDANTALSEPNSIVLTKTLAQKLFGNAALALNKAINFENGNAHQVTGVIDNIPLNSHFTFSALRSSPDSFSESWDRFYLYTYVLLKKNEDVKKLELKLPEFINKHPKSLMGNMNYRLELQPLKSIHLHSNLKYEISQNGNISNIYILSLVAALIFIIASINYMNLSTARSSLRIKEIGVRKVNGSARSQLIKMFLTESVLITFIAACIAVSITYAALPGFRYLTEKDVSIWRFGIAQSLFILAVFSLLTGLVSGIYPALFLSGFKLIPALKGQAGNQTGNLIFRKSLVIFQFVITISMIAGSCIIYQQLQFVIKKDVGFNKEQVITFHLESHEMRAKIPALKKELLQNPLIESIAAASNPIGNNSIGGRDYNVEINGKIDPTARIAKQLMIDEDFISTLGIHLVKGRNFLPDMSTDKNKALIVNETLANDAGWTEPIGKKIQFGTEILEVAGVVKDFNIYSLQHKIEPLILQLPQALNDRDNIFIRLNKQNIPAAIKFITYEYRKFDPEHTPDYHFLDQDFAHQYEAEQKQGNILLVFTILSIIIACLGLFGLVSFMAEQRIKEIGIRKVLGASVSSIVSLLSKDFMKLVIISIVIASPIAWWVMNKWLQDFAYRISISGWVFVFAGITALLIALTTISFQAIKAAIANTVKSLRTE